jgi:hypothetical protein
MGISIEDFRDLLIGNGGIFWAIRVARSAFAGSFRRRLTRPKAMAGQVGAASEHDVLTPGIRLIESGVSGFCDLMGVDEIINESNLVLNEGRFIRKFEGFM